MKTTRTHESKGVLTDADPTEALGEALEGHASNSSHELRQPRRTRRTRRESRKGTWERGYLCHVYWVGKRKLGVIATGPRGAWDGSYRWTCTEANIKGVSNRLALAKSLIESVIHAGVYQFDLFAGDSEHNPAEPVAAATLSALPASRPAGASANSAQKAQSVTAYLT